VRKVAFRMVNKGNRRLVINEIDRLCGCSDLVRKTMLLPPGGSKDWVLSIDTSFEEQSFERLTSFTTNDPARPRFDLLVKGTVYPAEKLCNTDANQQRQNSVLVHRQSVDSSP
jgi:hypothetical protein